tara:strand:+ start:82 stop:327 length:246 start_codon:yes stop_codon:yes gene_type:complete
MITSGQLDEIAIKYNKNKDKYVYDLWFEKVKEWAYGVNNTKRRIVSVSSCHKRDDGTYLVIGRSRLHGDMRDTKTKTKWVR